MKEQSALDFLLADGINMTFLWNEKQEKVVNAARKELKFLRKRNRLLREEGERLVTYLCLIP